MSGTIGKVTTTISVADELREFRSRPELLGRLTTEGKHASTKRHSRANNIPVRGKHKVPDLAHLCLEAIADSFEQRPVLFQLPEEQVRELTTMLPVDLDVLVASQYVTDENYWKRRCLSVQSWKNCNLSNHGLMWKQMFFERLLQEKIESYNPAADSFEDLHKYLEACKDFVFRLVIEQLMSHMDLSLLFDYLPNLCQLHLTYGVRQVGMRYERSLFGMKISDATSLAGCIKTTDTLIALNLPCNHIDDDMLRMLMTGLATNRTITSLDLSHNKITNHGARLIAKILGSKSVLTSLNLCDNQIHKEGGRYLGRAIKENSSLFDLNLRLNRLTDEGGRYIFDGLHDNSTLRILNLSSNSVGSESIASLVNILSNASSSLCVLDMSCNEVEEEDCEVLLEAILQNTTLYSLDLRMNRVDPSAAAAKDIQQAVQRNELKTKAISQYNYFNSEGDHSNGLGDL